MNTCPKVSILLAACNSGKTIEASIQSVLSQSYPNLQMILCDDGTKAFDSEEIRRFVQQQNSYVEVKIIHQPQNVGTVQNLNAGLKLADGEWIMLLAADDCFASESAAAHLMQRLLKSGREWAVARTALCDEQLLSRGRSVPTQEVSDNIIAGNAKELYLRLCTGCCLPAGGSIYRTDLLRRMGGFDETYRLTEDWPIFLKLVRRGLLPTISEEIVVLHRFGGVSRKDAGKNFAYQNDLITVLRKEVAPHIELLDERGQTMVRKLILDKEKGFAFRFSCHTRIEKLIWAVRHPIFIARKIFRKRETIC